MCAPQEEVEALRKEAAAEADQLRSELVATQMKLVTAHTEWQAATAAAAGEGDTAAGRVVELEEAERDLRAVCSELEALGDAKVTRESPEQAPWEEEPEKLEDRILSYRALLTREARATLLRCEA